MGLRFPMCLHPDGQRRLTRDGHDLSHTVCHNGISMTVTGTIGYPPSAEVQANLHVLLRLQ